MRPLASATNLSAVGMAFHTVREFGYPGLLALRSGFIPFVALQLLLLTSWLLIPAARRPAAIALFATGVLQLFGGAIISVLPLPFLPFVPEQSLHHYLSHAIFGLSQIPLILVARSAQLPPKLP